MERRANGKLLHIVTPASSPSTYDPHGLPALIRAKARIAIHRVKIGALFLVLLSSCATYSTLTNPHIGRLRDRGPVLVSADNPYVAANLLLQKLMDDSPEVKGFIEHRGAPPLLEVSEGLLAPPLIYFYYPQNNEYYSLENDKDFWVIEGPNRLPEEKLNGLLQISQVRLDVQPIQPSLPKAVPTKAPEKKPVKEKAAAKTELKPPMEADFIPFETPPETAKAGPVEKPVPGVPKKVLPDEAIVGGVLAMSPGAKAEISPKGDLVHYVTFAEETLSLIARWYTYDPVNAGKIARVSGISPKQKLTQGDVVIIPAYVLKNQNRLTEQGLIALRNSPSE